MAEAIETGNLATLFVTVWDLRGNIVDQTSPDGVTVRAGAEDVFPRLDRALIGKKKGEEFDVVLEPEESFGDFDENQVFLVPLADLGAGNVKKGMRFSHVPGIPESSRAYIVTDTADGFAVLDGNHPYAGWTLRFAVKILRTEEVNSGDVSEADIFVPDFLKTASSEIRQAAEDRLNLEDARRKIEKSLDAMEEKTSGGETLGNGLFTSLIPKKEQ